MDSLRPTFQVSGLCSQTECVPKSTISALVLPDRMKQCAVIGCVNSEYRIKKWKQTVCQKHKVLHGSASCDCDPPFRFFCFPTALKDPAGRLRWRTKIDRGNPDNPDELWDPPPAFKAVICSEHFIDGEPTQAHPDPELKLDKQPFRPHPRRIRRGYKYVPPGASSVSQCVSMVTKEDVKTTPGHFMVASDMDEVEPGEIIRPKRCGKEALNNWLKEAKQRRGRNVPKNGPENMLTIATSSSVANYTMVNNHIPNASQIIHTNIVAVNQQTFPVGSVNMMDVSQFPVMNNHYSPGSANQYSPGSVNHYSPVSVNSWAGPPEQLIGSVKPTDPTLHQLYSQADQAVMQFLTGGRISEDLISTTTQNDKSDATENKTKPMDVNNSTNKKVELQSTLVRVEETNGGQMNNVRVTNSDLKSDPGLQEHQQKNLAEVQEGETTQVMVHVQTIVKQEPSKIFCQTEKVTQPKPTESNCDLDSSIEINRNCLDTSCNSSLNISLIEPEIVNNSEKSPVKQLCNSTPFNHEESHEINLNGGVHYLCVLCQSKLDSRSELKTHYNTHRDSLPWKCPNCTSTFDSQKNIQNHLLQHKEIRPYICSYCQAGFRKVTSAKVHVMTHTGLKPFECRFCKKRFRHSSTLCVHVRSHTGEKPFKCKFCEKAFVDSKHMLRHQRTHTGDKPYSCTTCTLRFSKASTLKTHMRVHSGEKPYPCSHCGQSFAQTSTLKSHIRQHTGEKPFSCPYCSSTFTHSSAMRSHQRTHTGVKPYRCTQCGATFTWLSAYKRHIRGQGRNRGCTVTQEGQPEVNNQDAQIHRNSTDCNAVVSH